MNTKEYRSVQTAKEEDRYNKKGALIQLKGNKTNYVMAAVVLKQYKTKFSARKNELFKLNFGKNQF
jgi:hypothetical protein